ncbi:MULTISPECIES: 3-hydroxyisobutyrate dehydrogenase [Thalassospira]|jgi:3-hydroxyisobutyrate dehydrogenase|uniref:3-hydroxyisobutyrate dehydrogenase n=1 Tax=Thalassospira povalilytica TaxID=732237 RepID=A0A8I1M962_9PROT|nr:MULTISPECIES: 3-hydroxyisobutyrate dehydrogenase [Thalassospira]KZB60752.1 3-hydroxyisobutyrate dehydrogenase [Thalassospira sp. MCCC 1A02491]MAL40259.1 3-hydroxyisobutyrate dehydrogenase [Thalassospira sp.]MBN8197388.1 3-hydroxyisobutyrate dehydrogenase [Thalassospira povalilytica]MBO6771009.1 3-hydroxyisobutyrate dehydrogenase [Thalassospira sp.]PKR51292.1 3-hydroxyisobutyrate dehydrogenase [Thalassospira povalilytica]
MATIGFIGLGNMGGPMAANLVKAGHDVKVFDLSADAVAKAVDGGAGKAATVAEAASNVEFVVTVLPAGKHVLSVYDGPDGVIANAKAGTVLIDSSTIEVDAARKASELARAAGLGAVDAPISGGTAGAAAGTLTFMVGGSDADFARAKPILEGMGSNIIHAGDSGAGQAAKICNNMVLGVSMIAVSEAFMLAKRLGLDAQKLFDISSKASGQCWSLTSYCPVPGPVPTSPANRDYQAGFAVDMMLKDLKLAQQASAASGATTPMGALAESLYALYSNSGHGGMDFSAIVKMLDGEK